MRIAFLTTTSLESPSVVGRVLPLAREIASRDHEVHLIALHHDLTPDIQRHYRDGEIWIHYVGQMHVRKHAHTSTYFNPARLLWVILRGTLGLLRYAYHLNADIYHLGKPHPQNSVAGIITAKFFHRRSHIFLDCDDYEAGSNRVSNVLQRAVLGQLENTVPRMVAGVTVNTHFQEQRLAGLGIPTPRILHLPSFVDQQRFHPRPHTEIAALQSRLNVTETNIVLYVGTLSRANHPVDLLLYAFAQLLERCRDTVLVIVGGGPDHEALRELAQRLGIAESCHFVGRVPPKEIPLFFQLATVSVDPVNDDLVARARFPVKVMESLAAGVPVVTGDVGDRREMLGGGTAGVLVRPGDAGALAEGLRVVLDDSSLRGRLQAGCRAQSNKYDPAKLTDRLLAFYRSTGGIREDGT